jgi:hypothetical protein
MPPKGKPSKAAVQKKEANAAGLSLSFSLFPPPPPLPPRKYAATSNPIFTLPPSIVVVPCVNLLCLFGLQPTLNPRHFPAHGRHKIKLSG